MRSNKGLLLQAPRVINHTTLSDRAFSAAGTKTVENFNTFITLLETHFFKTRFLAGPKDIL